jgi:hypothetical protein
MNIKVKANVFNRSDRTMYALCHNNCEQFGCCALPCNCDTAWRQQKRRDARTPLRMAALHAAARHTSQPAWTNDTPFAAGDKDPSLHLRALV